MSIKLVVFTVIAMLARVQGNCGGAISVPRTGQANFKSPNYNPTTGALYPSYSVCNYLITGAVAGPLHFFFNRFALQFNTAGNCARGDYVRFSERINGKTVQIGDLLCGESPVKQLRSQTNVVNVLFVSDGSIEAAGFDINVSSQDPCSRSVNVGQPGAQAVVVTSQNFPSHYYANSHCNYEFTSPAGTFIKFVFHASSNIVASGANCLTDSLTFTELINGTTYQIGLKRCGNLGGAIVRSTSNRVNIQFVSDRADEAAGFRVDAVSEQPQRVNVPATGTVQFQSPNYPSNYPVNAYQLYEIVGPVGSKLVIDRLDFLTENGLDTLTFTEVVSGAVTQLGPILSGNLAVIKQIRSNTNQVRALFVSDGSGELKGFRFEVSVQVPCMHTVDVPEFGFTFFNSPNFPRNYHSDAHCHYSIIGPKDSQLHFNVAGGAFVLEDSAVGCDRDHLTFSEVLDGENVLLGEKFCRRLGPVQLVSTTNNVTAVFQSDGDNEALGFRIMVSTEGFFRKGAKFGPIN